MNQIPMDFTNPRMSEAAESFLQTALDFTEYLPNGDSMSVVFTVNDFADVAVAYVERKIRHFMMNPLIARCIETHKLNDGVIGARLWTLRANHGIGFWDDIGMSKDTQILDHAALCQGKIEIVVVGGPDGPLNLKVMD